MFSMQSPSKWCLWLTDLLAEYMKAMFRLHLGQPHPTDYQTMEQTEAIISPTLAAECRFIADQARQAYLTPGLYIPLLNHLSGTQGPQYNFPGTWNVTTPTSALGLPDNNTKRRPPYKADTPLCTSRKELLTSPSPSLTSMVSYSCGICLGH